MCTEFNEIFGKIAELLKCGENTESCRNLVQPIFSIIAKLLKFDKIKKSKLPKS